MGRYINLDLSRHNSQDNIMYFHDFIDTLCILLIYLLQIKAIHAMILANEGKSCFEQFSVYFSLCHCVVGIHAGKYAINPSKQMPVLKKISVNTMRKYVHVGGDRKTEHIGTEWMRIMTDNMRGNSNN